jgi:membrane-bound metal-dependent hydrolase YbcI (DUF457 family)
MAGFKTHIATSTAVGLGYGAAAYATFDLRLESCAVAAGLCSVAGILPDIDSESGQTVREITGFAAAVVPLLLLDQLKELGLSHESVVLAGGCLYIIMRFGLAGVINRLTVHRGMWHSIPAALVAGLVTSWLCSCPEPFPRLLKVVAVVIGYMTHLILDEIFSFELYRGRFRIKKSFGTALKFWSPSIWANSSAYAMLLVLVVFSARDPSLFGGPNSPVHDFARSAVNRVLGVQSQHDATVPISIPHQRPSSTESSSEPDAGHDRRDSYRFPGDV